jgi:hypothetical protein
MKRVGSSDAAMSTWLPDSLSFCGTDNIWTVSCGIRPRSELCGNMPLAGVWWHHQHLAK